MKKSLMVTVKLFNYNGALQPISTGRNSVRTGPRETELYHSCIETTISTEKGQTLLNLYFIILNYVHVCVCTHMNAGAHGG